MSASSLSVGWITAVLLLFTSPWEAAQEKREGQGKQRSAGRNLVPLADDYVRYARVPEQGRQPRLQVGPDGTIAVLFFRGEDDHGDLFLTRTPDEGRTFTPSVKVNTREGTVLAQQANHMASAAIGPDGRAHVAWVSTDDPPAVLYTSEGPAGTFEPEHSLFAPQGLGPSAAVTVDREGRVYVFCAARGLEVEDGQEPGDRVWLLHSVEGEEGAGFSEPRPIDKEKHSVSTSSALAAHVDAVDGTVFLLYRTAFKPKDVETKVVNRDVRLLSSEDRGETFKSGMMEHVKLQRDPESMVHLCQEPHTTMASWDGNGSVYWSPIQRSSDSARMPVSPRAEEDLFWRSDAAVAANARDEVCLAWLSRPREDPSAEPVLVWQVWQKSTLGKAGTGQAPEAPGRSSPAVLARADGGFTILY
jgi:hypothetical protein